MFSNFKRWATIGGAIAALAIGLVAVGVMGTLNADTPDPTTNDTARLLGYMWADGSYDEATQSWDLTGPSGGGPLIEELVNRHGGEWIDQVQLIFRLPAPYDWADWKDSLPNDDDRVRDAVQNPHFLAAVLEGEGSVAGLIYDQSTCCTPGFTQGRLTDMSRLLSTLGYETATITQFTDVDSGRINIAASEFAELRSQHQFVCTVQELSLIHI